jgi:hypothetical protein
MSDPGKTGIVYCAIALVIMVLAIISTFYTFDVGFLRKSLEVIFRPGAPLHFRLLGSVTVVTFVGVIILSLLRGLKMWRADSWKTGRRTIEGVELKFEAAVIIGLGVTVFFFAARGLFQ